MVNQAIAILQDPADLPAEGYYLAFSGGKDSIAVKRLADMAGVPYDAHYNVCPDPPELMRFIRQVHPEIPWNRDEHTFYWYLERKPLPTFRLRWCCEKFKHRSGKGRTVLTGIRAEESPRRAKRGIVHDCLLSPGKRFVNPIFHWKEAEVWEFIRAEGLPYCSVYDEGWRRLGCVPCPFERRVAQSMARWPRIWENCRRAWFRGWPNQSQSMLEDFGTAEAAWEWWLSRKPYPRPNWEQESLEPALFV